MSCSKQALRTLIPHDLTIQAFTLYRMRFAFSADLCKPWRTFGGLGCQLSHFATVLHISITESVGAALSYRRLVNLKLQEKPRKRSTPASDFVTILAAGNPPLKEQAKKEVAMAIEADQRTRDRPEKGKGKGPRISNYAASGNAYAQNAAFRDQNDSADDRRRSRPPTVTQLETTVLRKRAETFAYSCAVTGITRARTTTHVTDLLVPARRARGAGNNNAVSV